MGVGVKGKDQVATRMIETTVPPPGGAQVLRLHLPAVLKSLAQHSWHMPPRLNPKIAYLDLVPHPLLAPWAQMGVRVEPVTWLGNPVQRSPLSYHCPWG